MTDAAGAADPRVIDLVGVQALIDVLIARGYTVLGPTVRDGAISTGPISAVSDLPVGWGDDQDAAHYRLIRRDDQRLFGFAAAANAAKPVFFPAHELSWRGRRTDSELTVEPPDPATVGAHPHTDGPHLGPPPYALLGVRSCDLAAVGIHDAVLLGRHVIDARYAARRAESLIVAVSCSDPGGTCFCASTGTGPTPTQASGGFDLALTELLDDDGHRFVVQAAGERGEQILAEIPSVAATSVDLDDVEDQERVAKDRMGRVLDTDGLRELLYAAAENPRWDDVASRCLSCANCTAVCPTCFCVTFTDSSDLTGTTEERHRVWDSCFASEFSYLHGGVVRSSTRARYRQWMTHKLGAWIDQFGMSGCVGCGRCITWCPAAIDITEEAAALRGLPPAFSRLTPPRTIG